MGKHLATAAALAAVATSALAAPPAYLGVWTIRSAVVAPWADKSSLAQDTAEKNRLIGKTVTLGAGAITGPQPFPCRGPHYKLSSFTPDMLFQGELGEMQSNDPKVNPAALAAQLGFAGAHITVLETGCEIDWHFVDAHTVEIGLDNYVYKLTK